jgi:hypothetical protein
MNHAPTSSNNILLVGLMNHAPTSSNNILLVGLVNQAPTPHELFIKNADRE